MKDKQGIELMVGDRVAIVDAGNRKLAIDVVKRVEDGKVYLQDCFPRDKPDDILLIPTEGTGTPGTEFEWLCDTCGKWHKLNEGWKKCTFGEHCHRYSSDGQMRLSWQEHDKDEKD